MTKRREVLGDINESTGGNYKIFSEKKIVTESHSHIAQKGYEKGIAFKIAQKAPQFEEIYSLAQDLAHLSMVVMYNDGVVKVGAIYKRTTKAHAFKLIAKLSIDFYGFRCYHFRFKISQKVFNAVVFVGTRSTNIFSVTDNVTQAFRASIQVEWSKTIGNNARKLENVIFAGHSKGGREAAQAAIEHGSATVYSYNTSIAYLDDHKKVRDYISNGGVMHHFTLAGELLMMNKANGWNAGFQPTIVYGDDVMMRTVVFHSYNNFGEVSGKHVTSYYCRPDNKAIGLGEQSARHTDYELMLKGLRNARIMSPGTMRYFR